MLQRHRRLACLLVLCLLLMGCQAPEKPETLDIQAPTAAPTPSPAPEITPTIAPTQAPPTETPASTPEPKATQAPTPSATAKPLAGLVIGLDPGHQSKANREQEPVAPGSSETKNKVSSGTQGAGSGVYEHEVNLAVGLLLRNLLEEAGATVIMTRTTADVDISNVERAQLFNKYKVDLGIRLHCNGAEDSAKYGAFMLVNADKNFAYYTQSVRAAELILAAYGSETGLDISKGITYRSDQTGFNWCERPVVNIEMGHLTNTEEDKKLVDSDFQKKMARGIFKGILAYFTEE